MNEKLKWNTWNKQCLDQNLRLWETYKELKEIDELIEKQPATEEEEEGLKKIQKKSLWNKLLDIFN